jgi:hypothetical protein
MSPLPSGSPHPEQWVISAMPALSAILGIAGRVARGAVRRTRECHEGALVPARRRRSGCDHRAIGSITASGATPGSAVRVAVRSTGNPVGTTGETFLRKSFVINYTGGTVTVAGDPTGVGQIDVDDALRMTIKHADGTSSSYYHDFSANCTTARTCRSTRSPTGDGGLRLLSPWSRARGRSDRMKLGGRRVGGRFSSRRPRGAGLS